MKVQMQELTKIHPMLNLISTGVIPPSPAVDYILARRQLITM